MKKTISIPKEVFENIFFSEGGQKQIYKTLTGNKQFEEKNIHEVNANVEDSEWIKDSEGLREVEGKKHKDGGVDVKLEDGAKVLSDKRKIGQNLAKELNKQYEVSLKATHTYAEALDKIQIKLGLDKINSEQEKLIEKIDYQQKNVKDTNTLSANLEVLSSKLKDLEDEKKPIEEQSKRVFEQLFQKQEEGKAPEEKINTGVFEEGGTQSEPKYRIKNIYEDWEAYKKQKEIPNVGSGVFGSEIDKTQVISEIKRLFPNISSQYIGEDGKVKKPKEFQQAIQNYYYDMLTTAKNLYGQDSPKYKEFEAQVYKDGFTSGDPTKDVRSFDGKFGNFTSTRPNYGLEIVPEEIKKQLDAEGIYTIGQLKEKKPEIYQQYVGSKDFGFQDDAHILSFEEAQPTPTQENESENLNPASAQPTNEVSQTPTADGLGTRMGVANLPDQTPLTPDTMGAHLKTNTRYERADFKAVSPEQQLMELQKMSERAENNLDMMPPQQRASLSANLLATQADQTTKILQQTNQFNTQGQNQIDNINRQIQMQEQNAVNSNALNFEQRQMLAEAKTQADYHNFINKVKENDLLNYNTINNLNLSNMMYDNFQFTDRGVEEKGIPPAFKQMLSYYSKIAQAEQENQPTAKQKTTKNPK